MVNESSNRGLDELERISQQMNMTQYEISQREKQDDNRRKKTQDVLTEFRAFSVSIAVNQLQLVATPEMIEQVNALINEQGTAKLSELISSLANNLEQRINIVAETNLDIEPINQSMKALAILVRLLLSLST